MSVRSQEAVGLAPTVKKILIYGSCCSSADAAVSNVALTPRYDQPAPQTVGKPENVFCSIIVPTYNTDEERLAELVASIDAQTLSTERFELVFVDDAPVNVDAAAEIGVAAVLWDHEQGIDVLRERLTALGVPL